MGFELVTNEHRKDQLYSTPSIISVVTFISNFSSFLGGGEWGQAQMARD